MLSIGTDRSTVCIDVNNRRRIKAVHRAVMGFTLQLKTAKYIHSHKAWMVKVFWMMLDLRKNNKATIQRCWGIFLQFKVPESNSKIRKCAFSEHSIGKFYLLPLRSFNYIIEIWKINISAIGNLQLPAIGCSSSSNWYSSPVSFQ